MRTAGHSDSMIEKTTVSRREPSGIREWLRSTPSCLAPSRSIAARDCRFIQWVRNSTAMHSSRSNAWVNSNSLLSVLVPVRWAERAFQVDPISTRRTSGSTFMYVVMPMTSLVPVRRVVNGSMLPARCSPRRRSISASTASGRGTEVYQRCHSSPSLAALDQAVVVIVAQRFEGHEVAGQGDGLQERHAAHDRKPPRHPHAPVAAAGRGARRGARLRSGRLGSGSPSPR